MKEGTYTIVPGRGLVTKKAIDLRLDYLHTLGIETNYIEEAFFDHYDVQQNIESLVGSVELPTGLVGPILFNQDEQQEEVYCLAGTLEGALVASMNRGAKAVSLSGGFTAMVIHQKMLRAPVFYLSTEEEAENFACWINDSFDAIRDQAEAYSNHAKLISLETIVDEENVHLKFTYTTGDAAGQNMTTTCTWHAVLWMIDQYELISGYRIIDFLLEGNGASDKKVSHFLIDSGRGIKVEAKCTLTDEVIKTVLRTTSEKLYQFYKTSRKLSAKDGMVGYNFNVANVVAAIFVATGQDLASIHESSVADLEFTKITGGLEVKLTLFSLVIGSIGGGTHLSKQQQALQLMNCSGKGKVQRLASLIAGFAIGLEMSTLAALASGEFAKAHEKLGRNKPVDWVHLRELNAAFLEKIVAPFCTGKITAIQVNKVEVENGIIMNICRKLNQKIIGFIPVEIETEKGEGYSLFVKSKALDLDVIKGLHLISASIDPALSDLLAQHKYKLEYANCHLKELLISEALHTHGMNCSPAFYGKYTDPRRELFLLFQERLQVKELLLLDSENTPEQWTAPIIKNTIEAINKVHRHFILNTEEISSLGVQHFDFNHSIPLYEKLIDILCTSYSSDYGVLSDFLSDLIHTKESDSVIKTLIHNDFSPRNIAVRKNEQACIYDWELSVVNYPQRDIVELLSFTFEENFDEALFLSLIDFHYQLAKKDHPLTTQDEWNKIAVFALKEFIITRVIFYKAAEIVLKMKFIDRVYSNCLRMIHILERSTS